MPGIDVRISELPAATEGHADDRFETTQVDGATLVSRSITLEQVSDAVAAVLPPPAADWDSITGKPSTFPPDPEAVDDRVAALIVAGTNMTATYNDVANTLTLASTASGGGGGTVTSTSVVSANGLAGTVATATTTPAITLSTTITGMLKGNGTAISAGVAGTDYVTPAGLPTALPPNGAAGGALTGTYPNPTLVGGPLSNYALTSSIPTTLPPNGAAGGGLAGTYPNPTIKPSVTNGDVLTTVAGVAAWAAASGGALLQSVSTQTGAVATGTTILPFDNTIPQITEGSQFMTLAITPKSATSTLIITVNAALSPSVAVALSGALFRDAAAGALAAMYLFTAAGGYYNLSFTHTMVSGGTSAITFRFRAGGDVASTITFNGTSGARIFGGVMASSIVINEIAP